MKPQSGLCAPGQVAASVGFHRESSLRNEGCEATGAAVHKHQPKFGSWIPAYLKALETGVLREAAYRAAGVCRQSVWEWKKHNPDFVHFEQMARDRGAVEKLIRRLDAEGVEVEAA